MMTDVDPLLGRRPLPPPTHPATTTITAASGRVTSRTPRPPARGRRRHHPALGARIAAAGIGMSTMLGLIASMGIASAVSDQGATDAVPSTAPLAGTPTLGVMPVSPVPAATSPQAPAAGSPQAAVDPAPVTLTARPDVRVITPQVAQAPAAPAPAATTSGSR